MHSSAPGEFRLGNPSLFSATLTVFRRSLRLTISHPVWVILGLLQPVAYLYLFGPLLVRLDLMDIRDLNAWQFFVPGLMVQLALFSSSFVGFGFIDEYRSNVITRMQVTPAPRLALLLGRVCKDGIIVGTQALLLLLLALPLGLEIDPLAFSFCWCMALLVGMSLASLSYSAALLLKSEAGLAPIINLLTAPLLLLSGILLPLDLGPSWLQRLALFNPLWYAVEAMRESFAATFTATGALVNLAGATLVFVAILAVGHVIFARRTN